jgi:hypothetical protein
VHAAHRVEVGEAHVLEQLLVHGPRVDLVLRDDRCEATAQEEHVPELAVRMQGAQIGRAEMDLGEHGHRPVPGLRDAERLANRRVRAVAADHVRRPHGALLVALARDHRRHDAVGVLLDVRHAEWAEHLDVLVFEAAEHQQLFHLDLRDPLPRLARLRAVVTLVGDRRAHLVHARQGPPDDLFARHRGGEDDVERMRRPDAGGADVGSEIEPLVELHAADVRQVHLWERRRVRVALHKRGPDAVRGELERERHPDRSGARDQNGRMRLLGHSGSRMSGGVLGGYSPP